MESNIKEDPDTNPSITTAETPTTTQIGENVTSSLPFLPLSDGVPLQEEIKCLTPEETQSDNKGLRAVTIVCTKCHRHEIQYLAEDEYDPEFLDIPAKKSKEGDRKKEKPWDRKEEKNEESCLSRRRKYYATVLERDKSKCIPVTGPVTEYKDAYRNPDGSTNPKAESYRPQFQPLQRIRPRPPWNSSISIPPPPYQETLNAIETKLKVLDEAEDPPPDVMAAILNRQNLREKYRQKRNGGGDGECDACCDDASPKDSEIPSPWGWLAPQNQPRVFVQGSHLELLEDESLFSDV